MASDLHYLISKFIEIFYLCFYRVRLFPLYIAILWVLFLHRRLCRSCYTILPFYVTKKLKYWKHPYWKLSDMLIIPKIPALANEDRQTFAENLRFRLWHCFQQQRAKSGNDDRNDLFDHGPLYWSDKAWQCKFLHSVYRSFLPTGGRWSDTRILSHSCYLCSLHKRAFFDNDLTGIVVAISYHI